MTSDQIALALGLVSLLLTSLTDKILPGRQAVSNLLTSIDTTVSSRFAEALSRFMNEWSNAPIAGARPPSQYLSESLRKWFDYLLESRSHFRFFEFWFSVHWISFVICLVCFGLLSFWPKLVTYGSLIGLAFLLIGWMAVIVASRFGKKIEKLNHRVLTHG